MTPRASRKAMPPRSKPIARRVPPQSSGLRRTATHPGAAIARTGKLQRNTPIKAVSPKRIRETRTRRALVRKLYPVRPRCAVPWCALMADDIHETLTRARSGGLITDPGLWAPTCRGHNRELTLEPRWGYDLGLLHHAWDHPGEPAPGALTREAAALLLARDRWCVHCGSVKDLRPHLRQQYGEHAGCACGWVMMCPACRDLAAAGPGGGAVTGGLLIPDDTVAPFMVSVLVHLPGDGAGTRGWPLCDGSYSDEQPEAAAA